jgi:hypothetical protein
VRGSWLLQSARGVGRWQRSPDARAVLNAEPPRGLPRVWPAAASDRRPRYE